MTFPYESQWGDIRCNEALIVHGRDPAEIHDWRQSGYVSVEDYRFWSRHVCGLACLRSVLRGWMPDAPVPPMGYLLERAVEHAALTLNDDGVRGLYYRPFLAWIAEEYGLQGQVVEHSTARDHFVGVGVGRVAFASVSSEIRYPDRPNTRRGGHLVLVHAFDGSTVTFHNPSGVNGTADGASLDIETFERFYAGRGMIVRRTA